MKKFVRALLILVMIIMTVTAVGCGGNDETTTVGGNATTVQKLQAVVNIIQRGDSVDVDEFFEIMGENKRPRNIFTNNLNLVFLDTCYFKSGVH